MRNGVVYVHQISGIPTDGRGFSLWPTAQTTDNNLSRAKDPQAYSLKHKSRKNSSQSLAIDAQLWPPARGRFDSGQHRGSKDSLHGKAKDWKTPHGMAGVDRTGRRGGPGGGEFAKQANNWATPQAEGFRQRGGARMNEMGLDQQARRGNWRTPQRWNADQGPKSREFYERCIKTGESAITLTDQTKFHMHRPAPDLLTLASITSSNFTLKNLKKLRRFLRPSANKPSAGRKSSSAGPGSRPPSPKRRLSKIFVAWLMGFPLCWAATGRRGESLRECFDLLTRNEPKR